jgi:hypothetical protein
MPKNEGLGVVFMRFTTNRQETASLFARSSPLLDPVCGHCGGTVVELSGEQADLLSRLESYISPHRAFECASCEVIMFDEELTDGHFVPHTSADPVGHNGLYSIYRD